MNCALTLASKVAPVFQILAFVIAVVAVGIAWMQYRAARIIEISKLLEDSQIRCARRMLYKELVEKTPPNDWWKDNDDLEQAAGTVCSSFSTAGVIAEKVWIKRLIAREWAYTICWSHEALAAYLKFRRAANPNAYRPYTRLYCKAKHLKRN
jgi:hypothetical protein